VWRATGGSDWKVVRGHHIFLAVGRNRRSWPVNKICATFIEPATTFWERESGTRGGRSGHTGKVLGGGNRAGRMNTRSREAGALAEIGKKIG